MKSKLGAVIVEGSGLQPLHYKHLINGLSDRGFTVRCPHLPTNGDPHRPPKATQDDSVAIVQTAIKELKVEGYSILLIMHSSGGGVGSEAATPELYAKSGDGGLVALLYLCAHLVQPGESIMSTLQKLGPGDQKPIKTHDFSDDGLVTVVDPLGHFFSDLADGEEAKQLADAVVASNVAIAVTPITRAPWKDLPTAYLLASLDQVLSYEHQKAMSEEAKANGGEDMDLVTIGTGHFPFLYEAEAVVNLALETVSKGVDTALPLPPS